MTWHEEESDLPENDVSVLTKNAFGFYAIEHYKDGKWRMCTVEHIFDMLNYKTYIHDALTKPKYWAYIDEIDERKIERQC